MSALNLLADLERDREALRLARARVRQTHLLADARAARDIAYRLAEALVYAAIVANGRPIGPFRAEAERVRWYLREADALLARAEARTRSTALIAPFQKRTP